MSKAAMSSTGKILAILLFLSPWLSGASGCPNLFSEAASKTGDPALLYQAQRLIDSGDFTDAITAIQSMTATGQAQRTTKVTLASAYAGRCGLVLTSLAGDLSSGIGDGSTLYPVLLSHMVTATSAEVDDCKQAETTLLSISSTASDRTSDENVLLAFVEFAKLGAILAASGVDADDNGTIDGAFDACTNDASNIVDADVQHIGTAITIAIESLSASGTAVADEITGTFTETCDAIDSALGTTGFCEQTDTSDFDATETKGLRALIKSNELGFNTCSGAVASSLACLCP